MRQSSVAGRVSPVLMAAVIGLSTPAHSQQKTVGKIGDFTILRIDEKGTFNRCSASMTNRSGMLRIAFGVNRQHYLSVPGVDGSGKAQMTLRVDGGAARTFTPHFADKDRASIELDYPTVDRLMAAHSMLDVGFGGRNYQWALGGQSMEKVVQAISNCVAQAGPAPQPKIQFKVRIKAGGWTIGEERVDGKFVRCTADMPSDDKGNSLRFSFMRNLDRFLSIAGPGSPVGSSDRIRVTFQPAGKSFDLAAKQAPDNRLWTASPLSNAVIDSLEGPKRIETTIQSSNRKTAFPLGDASTMLAAIDGCMSQNGQ